MNCGYGKDYGTLPPATVASVTLSQFTRIPTARVPSEPTEAEISECEVWLDRAWKTSPQYQQIMQQMRGKGTVRPSRRNKR